MNAVFLSAYQKADLAGEKAAEKAEEVMLEIAGYQPFAACGFAWIVVRPGNCKFARWLKKESKASKHYNGGVSIWVSKYGQSHDRKKAYARAFADEIEKQLILTQIEPNITVNAGSRLD